MKKMILLVLASTFSSIALAGTLIRVPVEIDAVERLASGNLTSARFSGNESERVGCGVRTYSFPDGQKYEWGFCQAATTEEDRVICTTEDEVLLDTIKGMNDYSFVTFRWDEDGVCSYLGNSTQSQYIPGQLR